jgi:Arc/MetJ family transcription regulator
VASINGHPIRYAFWTEAVLLDQVMSGLAGQPAPAPDETLQRLINEQLVLGAFPPKETPTTEQIEAQVTALEQAWGVDDDAVAEALERAGLTRAAFEQAIGRLLKTQAGLEALQAQGYDPTTWLEEQRASAKVVINPKFQGQLRSAAVPYMPPGVQSPLATATTSPIPTPTPEAALSLSTVVPATQAAPPTSVPTIPEVAPDFTLEQPGSGTFTLADQLAQGPVVLVFLRSGGG